MATVVLTGFMGTGKTSIGRRLAARLGRPFVDTDALIEQRLGRTVAAIFAESGEARFRAAERDAVAEACGVAGAVIATGGGAVVDAANRGALRAAAPVVHLTARPEVILDRVRAAEEMRPLLQGGDPAERIAALLAERAAAYAAAADLTLDTSDRAIDDVVADIEGFLRARRREGNQA
jgi:shikimate kinase